MTAAKYGFTVPRRRGINLLKDTGISRKFRREIIRSTTMAKGKTVKDPTIWEVSTVVARR